IKDTKCYTRISVSFIPGLLSKRICSSACCKVLVYTSCLRMSLSVRSPYVSPGGAGAVKVLVRKGIWIRPVRSLKISRERRRQNPVFVGEIKGEAAAPASDSHVESGADSQAGFECSKQRTTGKAEKAITTSVGYQSTAPSQLSLESGPEASIHD